MRILMLGDARTEHLARWSRHFRHRGDDVLVASANGGVADVQFKLPVRLQAVGYPMLVPVLQRLCAEWQPDLLLAHYLPNYGLLAVLSRFRPTVAVGWGSDLLVLPKRNLFQRSRLRYVATHATAFLVDAQMLVEPLVKHGAPVERVYVCPFGVDEDVLALRAPGMRPQDSVPVVLSTRRLEASYHVEVLLESLAPISKPFKAEIGNGGTSREGLENHAARLGLGERVQFSGELDRPRYLESLKRADIYVSTSPSDSTSVSLLEAMAAGLACVVPDIPGNREWITDGRNGVLYAPLDAGGLTRQLDLLLAEGSRRSKLGERAQETVRSRGRWKETIRRAELLFDELVNRVPCPGS